MSRTLTDEELAAVKTAPAPKLTPEDRYDMRQELAIKLLKLPEPPADPTAWAKHAAHNWEFDFIRNEKRRAEFRREMAENGGRQAGARRGPIWQPKEYLPREDAVFGAWLACEGARVMHVRSGAPLVRDVEFAYAQFLDSVGVWRRRVKS